MTPEEIGVKLVELEALSGELTRALEEAVELGLGVDYQRVSWRILEDFISYAREDLGGGEVERSRTTVEELFEIHASAKSQLEELMRTRSPRPWVPRYQTSPVDIVDGHFEASRLLPSGGKSRGPVIFTGYGHFDQVKKDLPNFPDYGINIIQIEIGPSSTILESGEVNHRAIESLIPVFDRAAEYDIAVNLLISPHYFPGWALEKYPKLKVCEGGFIKFCIDAPEARDIVEKHIRAVIGTLGKMTALHSICLTNEPIYRTCSDDENTRGLWADFLRDRFRGDLVAACDRLQIETESFLDFPVPDWESVQGTPIFYEWCIFNQRRFAGWHIWMADVIHDVDADIPVHAKIMPTFLWRKNVAHGVDPRLFSDLSEINGNDCWCMFNHGDDVYAQDWIWQNIFYDMLRSFGNKPVFNSENHIIKDRERGRIPPEHIRTALWQGAIHGQGATTTWVWERTFDPESDFAGSIMHRPLCARAAGQTALDLMRLAPEVTKIQGIGPDVGILYSMTSMVYQEMYPGELKNAYEALNFTGNRISFVYADRLLNKNTPKFLLVPMATHVEERIIEEIRKFIERDGKVVLLGDECLRKDEHDREITARLPDDPESIVELPAGQDPVELRSALLEHLPPLSLYPGLKDGTPAWGIEWLAVEDRGRRLVNAVNLLKSNLDLTWFGAESCRIFDLLCGRELDKDMTLNSLDPCLMELTRG